MGWTLFSVAAADSSCALLIPTVASSDFRARFSVDGMLFGATPEARNDSTLDFNKSSAGGKASTEQVSKTGKFLRFGKAHLA